MRLRLRFVLPAAAAAALGALVSAAATLPAHRTLRVLIVSDEVNPHGLSDAELTQPGDLSVALRAPGAALALDSAPDGVRELGTNELASATGLLSVPPCDDAAYDVLVYFSHRIPDDGPDAQARQDAFTAAVDAFLAQGGGLVSFHHGAYLTPGKEGMLDLVGGRAAGAVPWEPALGQDVIDVAPGHFVTSNGLTYDGRRTHGDAARGIPAAPRQVFNNAPDERYPSFDVDALGPDTEILFESDYDGLPRVLGFTHRRPGWRGLVVAWQPGEYEPHACNPSDRTFQILVNAIVHSVDATTAGDALLTLRRAGAGAGAGVELAWTGGRGLQCAFRSSDPRAVSDAFASSDGGAATDPSPPAGLVFYQVRSR